MNSSLRFWLGSTVLTALVLATCVFALLQWNLSSYTDLVSARLVLLGELRRGAVQQYFTTAEAELRFWSSNGEILDEQSELVRLWDAEGVAKKVRRAYIDENPHDAYRELDDAGDDSAYGQVHARLHPSARLFVTERGYYDFFLIGPGGDILYTVEKEADFATNLVDGPWNESGLARVFARVLEAGDANIVATSDMQAYQPSQGAPAIFMATAMRNEQGAMLGVIAFQLPTDRILDIMNYTEGMGRTGETYLVGSDLLMRSNSRFSDESTVLQQSVDTPTVTRALAGEQGVDVVLDYRGVEVMSAYTPMPVAGNTWAVMAEIDASEIADLAALERPNLAGPLAFMYALSLWTIWYWRNRRLPQDDDSVSSLDLGDSGGDGPGFDG